MAGILLDQLKQGRGAWTRASRTSRTIHSVDGSSASVGAVGSRDGDSEDAARMKGMDNGLGSGGDHAGPDADGHTGSRVRCRGR